MKIESQALEVTTKASPWPSGIAAVASFLTLFACFFMPRGTTTYVAIPSLIALVCSVLVYAERRGGAVAGVMRRGNPGSLEIESREVRGGWIEEHGTQLWVVLELTGHRTASIRVDSQAAGERLLDDLGVGIRQRALTLRVGAVKSGVSRGVLALIAIVGALVSIPATLLFAIFFATWVLRAGGGHDSVVPTLIFGGFMAAAWGVFLAASRAIALRTVTIGRDGVSVRFGIRAPKFVSFEEMELRVSGRRIALSRTLEFPTTGFPEASAIAARIERAQRAYRDREAARLQLLSRAGRSVHAWRDDLRALERTSVDYRSGVAPSELLAVIEDPASPVEQRVGAAVVLASSRDDGARDRLRIAIEATADPKLRVALERAAEGEIDERVLEAAAERHAS